MRTERPVFLSLLPSNFHWPIPALASIAHRLTGVGLFVGVGYLLWLLDLALSSASGFADAISLMGQTSSKLVVLFILANLIYHLFAGIKHLLLDFHIGDSFEAASINAWVVFALTGIAVAAAGVWLW